MNRELKILLMVILDGQAVQYAEHLALVAQLNGDTVTDEMREQWVREWREDTLATYNEVIEDEETDNPS